MSVVFHWETAIIDVVAEALFYQENDEGLFIRAEGHVTAAVSTDLRELILNRLTKAPVPPLLAADLSACEYMDSTFMGTLTGISQNLRELGQGGLRTLNVSPRNVELLENLGLNFLFAVEPLGPELKRPAEPGAELMVLPPESGPEKEIILAAHEALVSANPLNADRFRDVLGYLKQGAGK